MNAGLPGGIIITIAEQHDDLSWGPEHASHFLSENVKDGIYLVDAVSGKILHANQGLSSIFGYTITELEDMTVFDLHLPEDRPEAMDAFRCIAKGEEGTYEFWVETRTADGSALK